MKLSRCAMLIASGLLPLYELGKPHDVAAPGEATKRNFMNDKKERRKEGHE